MKTILYNPIFINPQAYYVFPRLTRWLQPDEESVLEPVNYIGSIEVKIIAYGEFEVGYTRNYTNTSEIDFSDFRNSYVRISLFTSLGSVVLGEWKIGDLETAIIDPAVLESLKAVVICDGKTNDDSNRDVIRNLVDPDNPFVASNFAWKLNSGYGKYETDFTAWQNVYVHNATSTKLVVNSIDDINQYGWLLSTRSETPIPSFTVKVKNLGNKRLVYYYNDGSDKALAIKDGINVLPASIGVNAVSNGFNCSKRADFIGLTIEQLPSHDGALVFDGVNDKVISTKTMQEMVGDTNAVTVVSMIHQISLHQTYTNGFTNYIESSDGIQYIRSSVLVNNKTGIYGYTYKDGSTPVTLYPLLGDKMDYTTTKSSNLSNILADSKFSVNGRTSDISEKTQIAWYWTIIANKVLTTDEIHQVIAYYNLDKHVKPDIYYDVKKQGLTNENHAQFNDKLIDYSGNGHNMQLYNIGWDETSGVNADGSLVLDGVNDYGQVNNIPIKKDYTVVAERSLLGTVGGVNSFSLISDREIIEDTTLNTFTVEKNQTNYSYSFGASKQVNRDNSMKFSYQTKYFYNGEAIPAGNTTGNNKLLLGAGLITNGVISEYCHAAINSLMVFPYSLDEFLIERQLKRHKLGTLHPDLIEFRPIVKSDGKLDEVNYFLNTYSTKLYPGDYMPKGSTVIVNLISTSEVDEFKYLKVNGKEVKFNQAIGSTNRVYTSATVVYNKAPLKIEVSLDNYIRYEDIQQPYPAYIYLQDKETGENIFWGDKIKLNTVLKVRDIDNLLPELYTINRYILNGKDLGYRDFVNLDIIANKNTQIASRVTYRLTNEPNVIVALQKLRLPNISYKRLGYIPDISGHGNNIKLCNSGYSGMSGADGYGIDFGISAVSNPNNGKLLTKEEDYLEYEVINVSPYFVYFKVKTNNTFILYSNVDFVLTYTDGANIITAKANVKTKVICPKDGTLQIIGSKNPQIGDIITIRQVGLYDGAFCFDGVNDYGIIPNVVTKQGFLKSNIQTANKAVLDYRYNSSTNSVVSMDNKIAYSNYSTYIDSILNKNVIGEELIDVTHNATILFPDNVSSIAVVSSNGSSTFVKMAMYAYASFPEISDESEIIRFNEIMGIEGKYVERPIRYFDAYGKTNQDTDKDTIADLVTKLPANAFSLKNIAYEGMSGYNGYPVVFGSNKTFKYYSSSSPDAFVYTGDTNKITLTQIYAGKGLLYSYLKQSNALTEWNKDYPSFRIRVTGTDTTKFKLVYYYLASANAISVANYPMDSDGVYTLPKSFASDGSLAASNVYIGIIFRPVGAQNIVSDVNITLEVLPDYENGLALDGVNDCLENTTFPALTDFTFITKRKNLLNTYDDGTMYIMKGLENNKWALLGDYWSGGKNTQYSFGQTNIVTPFDLIGFITPTSYNGTAITKGTTEDSQGMHVGGWSKYWKGVFYKLMIFDKSINMLSINMIKNLMNKDGIVDLDNPVFKNN